MKRSKGKLGVALLCLAMLVPSTAAFAEEPFKLKLEKHVQADGPADDGLRITRPPQMNLNATKTMPPAAPPLNGTAQSGVVDPGDFSLGAAGNGFNLNAAQNGFNLNAMQNGANGKLDAKLAPMQKNVPLRGSAEFVKTLANYDIDIIVDQSLSMRKRDCPGWLSRWDWCGMQLQSLSEQLTPYAPRGFTLTTFSSFFDTYKNANASQLHALFANPRFSRGTRLSLPLQARIGDYFAHRNANSKPHLIVVITDGVPVPRREPDLVAQTLIAASHKLRSPSEMTVVFFQIGARDAFGRYFLDAMDNQLVPNGARYDIVRSVSFEQLDAHGLTNELIASVRNFRNQSASR